jgi:hypothetical protein
MLGFAVITIHTKSMKKAMASVSIVGNDFLAANVMPSNIIVVLECCPIQTLIQKDDGY